ANATGLADRVPKITDFGLAKRLDVAVGQTRSGTVVGTPSYMAPEQASGESRKAGPPADIYALGAILYECLTGRPPFKGASDAETLVQVLTQEPVPPRRLQPNLSPDLEAVCLKCLEKEPTRRYASAAELADDLARFRNGAPTHARPISLVRRLGRWARRHPTVAGLTTAVALLLLIVAIVSTALAVRLAAAHAEAETARTDAEDHAANERRQRETAQEQTRLAKKASEDARKQAEAAKVARNDADRERRSADAHRLEAEQERNQA